MLNKHVLFIILALLLCSAPPLPSGELISLWQLQNARQFKKFELVKFQEHLQGRLPLYRKKFEKAAIEQELPWTFLAAVAYQESKWDNSAISHTGVKGLMQLTQQTAEHVGVEDREDPSQSIFGGAYYLRYLYLKTSPQLSEKQRWIQALCAYNLGWGHLQDAKRLARQLKKNPYDWEQFKTVLPLLQNKKYFNFLRYGPARGQETVRFVERVFDYDELLSSLYSTTNLTQL